MIVKANAVHIPIRDNSIQCVVTSPPYWGLRKYSGEQELVWGGDEKCLHDWDHSSRTLCTGGTTEKQSTHRGNNGTGFAAAAAACFICGAWRGAFGLEPRIEMYVEHSVQILREIRRVLRPDWTFATAPYKGAHFATFPPELVIRCLQAATKQGDLVLDPFAGSGTVGEVAFNMGRRFVLCDLAYQELQAERIPPMHGMLTYA